MTESSAEGGCRCGAIRYRVTGAPHATSLCHCDACRKSVGSPTLAWAIFAEDKVEITAGTVKIHESSPGVERGFCGDCGTSLTYRRANRPGLFDVTTGSLDTPDAFAPTKEIWMEQRLSWVASDESLPRYPEFSPPN